MFHGIVILLVSLTTGLLSAAEQQNPLYGAWQPVTYVIKGHEHPMSGLMIITPEYFSSNTLFKLSDDTPVDANANAGPYRLEGNKIVLKQWMQLHWRPTEPQENFLTQGVVEEIPYRIEGDKLIFLFPSGNRYISKKISD